MTSHEVSLAAFALIGIILTFDVLALVLLRRITKSLRAIKREVACLKEPPQ